MYFLQLPRSRQRGVSQVQHCGCLIIYMYTCMHACMHNYTIIAIFPLEFVAIMKSCVLACAGSDEPGEQLWPESEADV